MCRGAGAPCIRPAALMMAYWILWGRKGAPQPGAGELNTMPAYIHFSQARVKGLDEIERNIDHAGLVCMRGGGTCRRVAGGSGFAERVRAILSTFSRADPSKVPMIEGVAYSPEFMDSDIFADEFHHLLASEAGERNIVHMELLDGEHPHVHFGFVPTTSDGIGWHKRRLDSFASSFQRRFSASAYGLACI